jgi:hypothetical protein
VVDPGIVDHRVDAAEGVDRGVDDGCGPVFVGDRCIARNRLSPSLFDFTDDFIGGCARRPRSVDPDAVIGDVDFSTLGGQMEGVASPHTATGSGDDNHAAVET